MKELSIEQKAQRYDEAIKRAKELLEIGLKDTRDKRVVLSFFPELKESSDEEIRKDIVAAVETYRDFTQGRKEEIYTWLEKLSEQKSAWSREDEAGLGDALWAVQQARTLAKDENDMGNLWYAEKWLNSLKGRLQPNQYWSKEDEKIYQSILDDTVQENQLDDKQTDWLKSLKERVQPQPKQKWKQENTDDLTDFENAMMHIGGSFFGQYAGLDPNDTNAIKEQANLLLELIPK